MVVLGAAGLDTTVAVESLDLESSESRFTTVTDGIGQAGGFAARLYAAAGRAVSFVGGIGEDPAGHELRRVLASEGVDLTHAFAEPRGTARSVNLVLSDGRRRSFYDARIGDGRPGHARLAGLLSRARLVHANLPAWVLPLLRQARSGGAVVACDLQDLPGPDDPYRAGFIAAADIILFSAVDLEDPRSVAEGLWARNPGAIIIAGLGSEGALLGARGRLDHHPVPSLDLPIVDTTGAGDSLAVGFLVAHVLEGRTLEDALLRGQVTARHTCSLRQPKTRFAAPAEIESLLDSRVR